MFLLPAECRSGETQMLPFISNEKKWVGRGGIKFKTSITTKTGSSFAVVGRF